jgi:hypothetical protein
MPKWQTFVANEVQCETVRCEVAKAVSLGARARTASFRFETVLPSFVPDLLNDSGESDHATPIRHDHDGGQKDPFRRLFALTERSSGSLKPSSGRILFQHEQLPSRVVLLRCRDRESSLRPRYVWVLGFNASLNGRRVLRVVSSRSSACWIFRDDPWQLTLGAARELRWGLVISRE